MQPQHPRTWTGRESLKYFRPESWVQTQGTRNHRAEFQKIAARNAFLFPALIPFFFMIHLKSPFFITFSDLIFTSASA
jgi:hypothetical protein